MLVRKTQVSSAQGERVWWAYGCGARGTFCGLRKAEVSISRGAAGRGAVRSAGYSTPR